MSAEKLVYYGLLKKFGIIAVVLGIILAIIIIHQYYSSMHTVNIVSEKSSRTCVSDNDCVMCKNVCISKTFAESSCPEATPGNCICDNGTCKVYK